VSDDQKLFIANFVTLIMRSFFFAYYAHAQGASETELLIEHDITAAGSEVDKGVAEAVRSTIHCAVVALDNGVPFCDAGAYLRQQLCERIDELMLSVDVPFTEARIVRRLCHAFKQ
jgi:hypothetical protein